MICLDAFRVPISLKIMAPRHDLLHLGEKQVTPGEFLLRAIFGLGETHLLMRYRNFAHKSAK